jgi:hypothetical protein
MTSVPPVTAIRPGLRVMRGSTLTIPEGALRISISEDGSVKSEITHFQASIQTWTSWLVSAFARLGDTRAARKRLTEAITNTDDTAENMALEEEFQGSLQAISAAVFALDAFYGVIHTMIPLDKSEKDARQQNNTARAAWVADAVLRASRMPNQVEKQYPRIYAPLISFAMGRCIHVFSQKDTASILVSINSHRSTTLITRWKQVQLS